MPVNFNHIKLSRAFTEGVSALYSSPRPLHSAVEPEIAFWIKCGFMRTKSSQKCTLKI